RSPGLTRLLGSSADPALRTDSIAALVLLDEEPGQIADQFLSDPSTPAVIVAETIQLLHLVPGWNPATLPAHVRLSRDWTVSSAIREVILARDQGRRIV